jgi:hypothetical protein
MYDVESVVSNVKAVLVKDGVKVTPEIEAAVRAAAEQESRSVRMRQQRQGLEALGRKHAAKKGGSNGRN